MFQSSSISGRGVWTGFCCFTFCSYGPGDTPWWASSGQRDLLAGCHGTLITTTEEVSSWSAVSPGHCTERRLKHTPDFLWKWPISVPMRFCLKGKLPVWHTSYSLWWSSQQAEPSGPNVTPPICFLQLLKKAPKILRMPPIFLLSVAFLCCLWNLPLHSEAWIICIL